MQLISLQNNEKLKESWEKENDEGKSADLFQKNLLIARENWNGSALLPSVVSDLIRLTRLSFEPSDLYCPASQQGLAWAGSGALLMQLHFSFPTVGVFSRGHLQSELIQRFPLLPQELMLEFPFVLPADVLPPEA